MQNKSGYQSRIFLTLVDETKENLLSLQMLKSPIGLSHKILECLFTNKVNKLQNGLDDIKGFSAGITSSRKKSKDYKIASYYQYMFAFHQFVQSSFRARQGKVLEEVLDNILKTYCNCEVPTTAVKKLNKLEEICGTDLGKHDIDSFGLNEKLKKVLVIQIRSRDDTGGATAKGSLVELLNVLLKTNMTQEIEITYLVVIWVAMDSNQKNTTIRKFYQSINNIIDINEDEFFKNIVENGYRFNEKLVLKLNYGLEEFADSLQAWTGSEDDFSSSIDDIIEKIENWDDLWVSYAIANLEIEIKELYGRNNIDILIEKRKELSLDFDTSNYGNLVKSIDNMTDELIKIWKEDTLPVKSPSDSALYLRDLLFLMVCYEKVFGSCNRNKDIQTKLDV